MRKVERISFDDVKPFIRLGVKEHVSFENPKGAEWYGIRDEGKLISIFCLVIKGLNARFKSNYTLREYRGQGCLRTFIAFAIRKCIKRNVSTMSVYCTPMSVNSHRRMGARDIWQKGNVTFLRYRF